MAGSKSDISNTILQLFGQSIMPPHPNSSPSCSEELSIIHSCDPCDSRWLQLRHEFIPDMDLNSHSSRLRDLVSRPGNYSAFIATVGDTPVGFIEVSIRSDYVNGCSSAKVLFLEGMFVLPAFRGQKISRKLCCCAEQWAMERGCTEFASDSSLDDLASHGAHRSLGFVETERVVYFRKELKNST